MMFWRDKIAKTVCDALRPELDARDAALNKRLDDEFQALHVHLQAATETLADPGAPADGTLTPDQRTGLHAIRQQVGAAYNPAPEADPLKRLMTNVEHAAQMFPQHGGM